MAKAKTKAKPSAQSSNLDMWRNVFLYLTMGSAIGYGLLWGGASLMSNDSLADSGVGLTLITATMLGGMVMGLLYAYSNISEKKNN